MDGVEYALQGGVTMSETEKKRRRQTMDEYDYLGAACSTMDCTGLIPRGVVDTEELEAYEEMYPYRPPIVREEN